MSHSRSPAGTRQSQFLEVIDRDEAERRFRAHLSLAPLGTERVPLSAALDRVLAVDVAAPVDVPGFDRSNVDGFAVRSQDTFGAMEESPRLLELRGEGIEPGFAPRESVEPAPPSRSPRGGMLPRGADAVAMLEHTEPEDATDDPSDFGGRATRLVRVLRPLSPGENVSFAGSDMARGRDRMPRRTDALFARNRRAGGTRLSRRRGPPPTARGHFVDRERVGGGGRTALPRLYPRLERPDAGGGGDGTGGRSGPPRDRRRRRSPHRRGHVAWSCVRCAAVVRRTSKGAGDLSHRIVGRLTNPGIVVHGVALKPGKPLCLAVTDGRPVVVLPGFPTSALFTFHEFVAPVIRALAGRAPEDRPVVRARTPVKIVSEKGRTEYLLVNLVPDADGHPRAFPLGKGSGSVTTFSLSDGFIAIPGEHRNDSRRHRGGSAVDGPRRPSRRPRGDRQPLHGVGLAPRATGAGRFRCEILVGGQYRGAACGQTRALRLAGVHLPDPTTGLYNTPFLDDSVRLIRGYARMQGLVYRPDDVRSSGVLPSSPSQPPSTTRVASW